MGKTRTKWFLISLTAGAALFFLIDRAFLPGLSSKTDPYRPFRLLSTVVYLVKNDYVEPPNPTRTMQGALKGMVDSLDVLSSYLDPEHVPLYQERERPGLMEPGLILYKSYGTFPVVIGVLPGSPAALKKLEIGASISAVDDVSTLGMSMLEANLALKHRDDRPVRLRLVYGGGDRTVEVDRAALQDSPFSYVESEGTAGILTVHGFFPPLVDRIRGNLLPRITPDSAPLILDLRLCHDGTLDEAVRFVNLFLKERRIGHLEGRGGAKTELSAMENPALADQRLAVWIGRATIGPAELAASALQRHRKALLIGGPTLGLAAQRDFFALEDGSGVVLTTAVFRPDGGEELWLKGLKPDVDVAPEGPDQAALLDATLKGMTKR